MTWLSTLVLALAASGIQAFPSILEARDFAQPGCHTSKLCDKVVHVSDAQAHIPASPNALTKASAARTNCGALGICSTFTKKAQYVSTTGKHAWQSPSVSDIRGPCPGLNAAANHGYLPRNGLLNIQQTIDGLYEAYGMSLDLSAFLAAYSIAFDGDVLSTTWSIGGPLPANLLSGLVGTPQGDGYSHNNYEGDTSITRCDSYTNGGDAHSSSMTRFKYAYEVGMDDDRYTLDKFARLYAKNTHRSVSTNAYYFAPLFSTTLVSPAAYNFVINFMSNHTEAEPAGYLDGKMFKQWFGIGGEYPTFKWLKGQERIPDNWYRRPDENQYSINSVFADLIPEFLAYPDTFRFGGNVNGVNTYTGIDIANITGGAYSSDTILQGDNLACFLMQNIQQFVPLQLQGGVNDVGKAVGLINKHLPPYLKKLSCPQLTKFDSSFTGAYHGSSYKPSAPKSGPVNC